MEVGRYRYENELGVIGSRCAIQRIHNPGTRDSSSKMVIYQQYRNPGFIIGGGMIWGYYVVTCVVVKTRGLGGISPLGVASIVSTNIAMVIKLRCDRMLLKGSIRPPQYRRPIPTIKMVFRQVLLRTCGFASVPSSIDLLWPMSSRSNSYL